MKKLGQNIDYFLADLSGNQDQLRVNLRARQVRDRYKDVLQTVYRETAELFLAHTNNVYIMTKNDVKTLIVYVDESIFAAELNAQRELIKLKLLEQFGEAVEEFEIYVSRGHYKQHHPYLVLEDDAAPVRYVPVALSPDEEKYVQKTSSIMEEGQLRKTFEKAMTAALALNKVEKGETR